MQRKIPKWLKWEFWPYWFFYLPVYFLIVIHAIRARTLSYFTSVNPGMRMGGFSSYSKWDIQKQLSSKYLPKTVLLESKVTKDRICQAMKDNGMSFPVILKPNEGERGWKVEKISSETDLEKYLADSPEDLLLQEFIDLPEEYGVMYYRFPGKDHGYVSSLMRRDFLTVTGDGTSTLLQLFENSDRCFYYMDRLLKKFQKDLQIVLPEGERKVLEEIGNHNRGTAFLNANQLINQKLVYAFDEASKGLKEWYFGRFDVRTASYDDMLEGRFIVIEINGANSEPAHIYDPQMNIFKAYKDLFDHWNTIFRISMINIKRGLKPEPMRDVYRHIREHLQYKKQHPNISRE